MVHIFKDFSFFNDFLLRRSASKVWRLRGVRGYFDEDRLIFSDQSFEEMLI